MQVFLQTDRLVLRRFTETDEDNLFELNSDPDVMRFLNGGNPTHRHEVRTRIIPTFLCYYERFEGFGFWAAAEIASGQFLGWFHFRPPLVSADTPASWNEKGVAELGFRLCRSGWGSGYATEGSRALIDKGFTDFGVQRVVAETVAGNQASRRVLEKSGLIQVAAFAAAAAEADGAGSQGQVVYELTRAGWEACAG